MSILHLRLALPRLSRLIGCSMVTVVCLNVQPAFADPLRTAGAVGNSDGILSYDSTSIDRADAYLVANAKTEDQGDFLGRVLFYSLLAPWAVPYIVTHTGKREQRVMAHRPFSTGCGFFCLENEDADHPKFVVHMDLYGGYELSGHPYGGLAARLETEMGLGGSTALLGYIRSADPRASSLAGLGKTDLFYRFATTRWVQFRTGVGLRYLFSNQKPAMGIDFLYGIDIQWAKPVTSTFEFNAGSVGRSGLAELRGTLDVYIQRLRIYVGWQQAWFMGDRVGGPVLGLGGYL